jgi:26S proteasome regulatory subunit T1
VDAIGGSRTGGDETGSDNEVQRTMLQIVTELDGFDPRGNIKVRREGGREGGREG